MSVLYVLVPVALVLVGAAIGAFIWAARQGQFDDLATPSIRAVVDDAGEVPATRVDSSDPGCPVSGCPHGGLDWVLAPEQEGIAGEK